MLMFDFAWRWYKGSIYHEKKHRTLAAEGNEQARKVIDNINLIKVNRHRGQPWVSPQFQGINITQVD
jgi:hypothetical protein